MRNKRRFFQKTDGGFDDFQYTLKDRVLGIEPYCYLAAITLIEFDKLKKCLNGFPDDQNEFFESEKSNIRKEIKTLEEVNNKNFILYFGAKEEKDRFVIAAEYCKETLYSFFKKMTEKDRVAQLPKYVKQIAMGLSYLEKKRVVHKDIRPKNIFIKTVKKGDGTESHFVKIGHFGVTRAIWLFSDEGVEGRRTSPYTSPEFEEALVTMKRYGSFHKRTQRAFSEIEPTQNSIDIYAFGVTLLQVSTGLFFTEMNKNGGTEIIPRIPGELRDFLSKCLKFKASERSTAADLLDHYFVLCALQIIKRGNKYCQTDPQRAIEWYRKAAERDSPIDSSVGMFKLGVCYQRGIGVEKDLKLSMECYSKASEKGHAVATCNLGAFYKKGDGVEKDLKKAMEYFRKAAEMGDHAAMFNLGICYLDGQCGDWGIKKDPKLAFQWFKKAARRGYGDAISNVAMCLKDGRGVEKNHKLAFEWCRKGAKQLGHPHAMFILATFYRDGVGVWKNSTESTVWLRKAAEKGHVHAMYNLGRNYQIGFGVEKNFKLSHEWLQKAAKGNNYGAMYLLGLCYLKNGLGVEKNDKIAVEWFRKAAEFCMDDKKLMELGEAYFHGSESIGVKKDPMLATIWWEKSAKNGNAEAMFYLATNYLAVGKDPKWAVEWYRKAVEKDHSSAMFKLGTCYKEGTGVEKDPKMAVEWYRKSAEKGDDNGMLNLGKCYEDGTGVEKDPKMAVEWYRKAAEKGNVKGMLNLGKCFVSGLGVQQNNQTGAEWLQKASDQNNSEAFRILGEILFTQA